MAATQSSCRWVIQVMCVILGSGAWACYGSQQLALPVTHMLPASVPVSEQVPVETLLMQAAILLFTSCQHETCRPRPASKTSLFLVRESEIKNKNEKESHEEEQQQGYSSHTLRSGSPPWIHTSDANQTAKMSPSIRGFKWFQTGNMQHLTIHREASGMQSPDLLKLHPHIHTDTHTHQHTGG